MSNGIALLKGYRTPGGGMDFGYFDPAMVAPLPRMDAYYNQQGFPCFGCDYGDNVNYGAEAEAWDVNPDAPLYQPGDGVPHRPAETGMSSGVKLALTALGGFIVYKLVR